MRRGIQAPELNSGDSPLSAQAPSFYGGVPLTARSLKNKYYIGRDRSFRTINSSLTIAFCCQLNIFLAFILQPLFLANSTVNHTICTVAI